MPRQRRNLKSDSSSIILEDVQHMLCQRAGCDFDISVIRNCCICIKCFTAYNAYQKKGKELFENTAACTEFLEHLISSDESLSHPLRKRARSVDTTYSSTAAAATSSPPISVCHKWCYISLVFICVGKCLESQWSEDVMHTPTRRHCVKTLVQSQNSARTIALKALKNPRSLAYVMKGIGKFAEYELKICSSSVNSILRSQCNKHLHVFPWREVFTDCIQHCPCLTTILLSVTASKIDHPNRKKIVSMIICILAKFRCSKMSLLQRLLSALLFSSHVGTSV